MESRTGAPAVNAPVTHLVFKTHLDVGFTALAHEVVDRYIESFIPSALAVAAELRARGGPERFVWTTGSWLIDTFLERSDSAGRRAMEGAIEAGDIAWHALPFTLHSELCDVSLFEHGLSIAANLDARFGRRTIAAKMTDVPGHTRGIVPVLAAADVEFLHIGVNPACPAPDVPSVFRWRNHAGDGSTPTEVIVAYQRGGYGGLVEVAGCADSLLVAHTDDNRGPQTVEQVLERFSEAQALAGTGSEVRGSTLDEFARALALHRDTLPVVEDELGDTWIHGVGTDPGKVARFRELSRLRRRWIAAGQDPVEPAFAKASTQLLLVAEHTWGLDEKITLPDDQRFAGVEFAALRREPAGLRFEESWAEQRDYLFAFAAALPPKFGAEATAALRDLTAAENEPWEQGPTIGEPSLSAGWPESGVPPLPLWFTAQPGAGVKLGRFVVAVDPASGALVRLADEETGREWANAEHPLGRFRYQSFDEADYARFYASYNQPEPHDEWWALLDYTKPGIDAAGARSAWWDPIGIDTWINGSDLHVRLAMPPSAVSDLGCPPLVALTWHFSEAESLVGLDLRWKGKRATRLPEAAWLAFQPLVEPMDGWTLDKLGQHISPLTVVAAGGRGLHAVGRGFRHQGVGGRFDVATLDAPLVAPGAPRLLDPGSDPPEGAGGMHVNLYNNVWGTNFPMWNEGSARYRFQLRTQNA